MEGVQRKLIDGVEITLGGKTYVAPPMNFRTLRRFESEVRELGALKDSEITAQSVFYLLKLTPLLHASLQRNYPDLTLEEVEEAAGLDLLKDGKFMTIIASLFGVSGLREKTHLGEAPAAASSNGAMSMDSSSLPATTATST